jgi:alpha-L-fucosidase
MAVNSESIYGTTAGPFKTPLPWGRATAKAGKLYLHVFEWPADGKLTVPGYRPSSTLAYLLSDRAKRLVTTESPDGLVIEVPRVAPDPIASVIVLERF